MVDGNREDDSDFNDFEELEQINKDLEAELAESEARLLILNKKIELHEKMTKLMDAFFDSFNKFEKGLDDDSIDDVAIKQYLNDSYVAIRAIKAELSDRYKYAMEHPSEVKDIEDYKESVILEKGVEAEDLEKIVLNLLKVE